MQLARLHGASCMRQQGNGDKGQSVCGDNQHSQHSPVLAALGAVQSPSPAAWDQQASLRESTQWHIPGLLLPLQA